MKSLLLQRFGAATTPWGRWRLNLRVSWKRLSWRCLVGGTLFFKRLFDLVSSATIIALLMPLYVLVAFLIKLEDGGPVFFVQRRVGKHGKEFDMYKFRSMYMDADKRLAEVYRMNQHRDGVTFKMRNDPRITKVGKWLRRASLDELPQLFNVFLGEMSLVGPRPPLPREVAMYSRTDRLRLEVTPGITCLWQIGGRSEIDFSGQLKLDVQYIESQSFLGDLRILLKTVPAVLLGKGAY